MRCGRPSIYGWRTRWVGAPVGRGASGTRGWPSKPLRASMTWSFVRSPSPASGGLDAAFEEFELALTEHDRSPDPFHRARTLLALGRTQRRARRRAAARSTLDEALAGFGRLGATLWAEQTRVELARIGGRGAASAELTEAERRIADLVAEGRSNREVADALFLTVHTVETALTRIYRKLGVSSRAGLARLHAANT